MKMDIFEDMQQVTNSPVNPNWVHNVIKLGFNFQKTIRIAYNSLHECVEMSVEKPRY